MRISVVGVLNSARMFDRAPVLLRAACNFDYLRQQPIRVGAVHTIESLKRVQISQSVPVNCDVVLPPGLRYAIDRKANGLIYGDEKIRQHERNEASVNERSVRIAKNRE